MVEEVHVAPQRGVSPFFRQLFAVAGVVLYMTGTGANIAFPAVLLHQLRRDDSAIKLTPLHESWIASSLGLALMSGIAVSSVALQRLGRKTTNQVSSLPALAGWILMMMATSPSQLIGSRVLQGFGMGIHASAAPVSIAEYSSPANRGMFLATIAVSFASGMLLAHVFGTFLYWRSAALACGIVYILSIIVVTLSPETPPWLASKGYFKKCRKSFKWLRGSDPASHRELDILISTQRNQQIVINTPRWKYFLQVLNKPEFYKPLSIVTLLFILFQVSGMTAVPSYTVIYMDEVTNGRVDPLASMLLVDVMRFAGAVIACYVVNKYPRRTVLFVGSFFTVMALFMTSLLMYLRSYFSEDLDWIPVIPALLYVFGKGVSLLPIPWAVAGEVFPLAYRGLGSSMSGLMLSLMFFAVVKTAPATIELIGVRGVFCVYGILVSTAAICLFYIMPETKGRTLYDIECHFKGEYREGKEVTNMLELDNVEGG